MIFFDSHLILMEGPYGRACVLRTPEELCGAPNTILDAKRPAAVTEIKDP